MSERSHSKWNRTLTWMLSAALIAQGGIAVYAGDLDNETVVDVLSEESVQAVGSAEEAVDSTSESPAEAGISEEESISEPAESDVAIDTEDSTEDASESTAAETEGEVLSDGAEDFSSELLIEPEDTVTDGIYLGEALADNMPGQIIDGNVVFNGVSEETSLFVPVYGEREGSRIAVRDMTWESSDESVVSIFDTDSEDQLQLRSHKAGGAVITGTYQPTDESGAAYGEPMTLSFRAFVRGIILEADAQDIQLSMNEELSTQAIRYRLIDGTGETGVAADGQEVVWSVDDPQVVEVDAQGNLTAKNPGETVVTLAWGDFTASSKVSVTGTGVKLTPAKQSIKQTGATIIFAEAWDGTQKIEDPVLTWSSSDPSVATVDAKGIVNGIGVGTTNITATWNGVQSEPLQITVTAATDISVTTCWEDGSALTRPAQVSIQLTANGAACGDPVVLGTDTEWRHVWVLLDAADELGAQISYSVSTEAPTGYTAEVQGSAADGFTVVYRQK